MAEQQQQQQQQQQMQQQQQQHTPASMSASMSASEQGTPVSVSTPWSMLLPPASGGGTPYASPLQGALAPPVSEGEMMTHEGLQVYTVGHLLPRNTYVEDAQGNWSFDPAALGAGDVLGGLGGVEQQQQQGQGEMGGGGGGGVYGEDAEDGEEVVRPTPPGGMAPLPAPLASSSSSPSSGSGSGSGGQSGATQQKLRVRRSTFVPGWAVPPRVLLVDDDAVSRRLSSKFLKVFGCTTDVAVDGIGAVNKMNLEKYDLVLMDIVMPKLDGVSATNLIRKFDQGTPIISMTSNSKPNEIMTYYSSGMNDILPKPFTKEGLLDMLEKHLMHLKVIQQMSRISRTVGIPPLSDGNFEQALRHGASLMPPPPSSSTSTALIPSSANTPPNAPSPFSFQFFGDGSTAGDADDLALGLARVNPLAGMGLSDEQYGAILQNIVNGDGFAGMMEGLDGVGLGAGLGGGGGGGGEKRALEDGGDERGAKRSRFEVIE
ncbi:hypothetical protein HYPSUDRAFT_45783 [Hypholoma sublateritium FD-334 SS-4]|uniref:Response regulatory domain-containing protein n=1 Tax=Hypholoma sublateritium (strain FD-334 SS-4) TaxID=945553 RepID=A0A0D2PCA9_HYPSF|nr:hypothetical protein HYPSUDRAFT_45783 [Hypholoma sublateritium FD-334 SS-4]